MNWDELQKIWSLPGPWSVRPIMQGINNLTQIVETPIGSYILRVYDVERSLAYIRYELSILSDLQRRSLPFQIPAPVPTRNGELFAILSGTIITISTRLSGLPPQSDNLEQAHAAGKALAELVKALADVQMKATPQITPFPPSRDFEAWAGAKIDPPRIIQELPLAKAEQRQIIELLESTQALAPLLYQSLPQQIIHRDYDQSNILMEGNAVTGVLDFEFCGPDLRILDLAYALSQWPSGWWNTGKEWEIIRSCVQGYLREQRLTLEELEMLPAIFRLRFSTSLFYRLGRFLRGLETPDTTLEQIQETLIVETWLEKHEEELLRHIRRWYHIKET